MLFPYELTQRFYSYKWWRKEAHRRGITNSYLAGCIQHHAKDSPISEALTYNGENVKVTTVYCGNKHHCFCGWSTSNLREIPQNDSAHVCTCVCSCPLIPLQIILVRVYSIYLCTKKKPPSHVSTRMRAFICTGCMRVCSCVPLSARVQLQRFWVC